MLRSKIKQNKTSKRDRVSASGRRARLEDADDLLLASLNLSSSPGRMSSSSSVLIMETGGALGERIGTQE